MTDDLSAREKRSSVIIRALIEMPEETGTGTGADRRVRNLSRTGACIDHDGTLAQGMALRVTMGSIPPFDAEVMWVRERLAGIRFTRPVDLEAARQPRGRSASARPSVGWVVEAPDPYRRRG